MRKALPAFLLVGGAVATIYAFTWQRPAVVAVAVLSFMGAQFGSVTYQLGLVSGRAAGNVE